MKIILNVPDSSCAVGIFLNFKNQVLDSTITTTSGLFAAKDHTIITFTNDGKAEQVDICDVSEVGEDKN